MFELISANVLGRPLLDFVGGEDCKKKIESIRNKTFPLVAAIQGQVVKVDFGEKLKRCNCRIKISLVGQQAHRENVLQTEEAMTVTHYSIKLIMPTSIHSSKPSTQNGKEIVNVAPGNPHQA